MAANIHLIREQIRLAVDPLIIKLRQELYGSGITYGRYISIDRIPPSIPRTTGDIDNVTGSGLVDRFAIWTAQKELTFSNLITYRPASGVGGVYLASGNLWLGTPSPSGFTRTGDVQANAVGASYMYADNGNFTAMVIGGGDLPTLQVQSDGTGFLNIPDAPNNQPTYSVVVSQLDGHLYKTTAGGISSVPQRFGWYLDPVVAFSGVGPTYTFNTAFEVIELDTFIRDVPTSPVVLMVEWTDQYNPYFVGAHITPTWFQYGDTITIPAGTKVHRHVFPAQSPLTSHTSPGNTITPSGAYAVWMRLTVISGGNAGGLTTQLVIRSNGSI